MVLAKMQLECTARDLQIERRVRIEAMLPVEIETEKAEVEILRLSRSNIRKTGTTRWIVSVIVFSHYQFAQRANR
jgi:hypothetical protein